MDPSWFLPTMLPRESHVGLKNDANGAIDNGFHPLLPPRQGSTLRKGHPGATQHGTAATVGYSNSTRGCNGGDTDRIRLRRYVIATNRPIYWPTDRFYLRSRLCIHTAGNAADTCVYCPVQFACALVPLPAPTPNSLGGHTIRN